MNSYVPEYLKSRNRKLVFDLFVEQGELSRAEIVQRTGMSFPTVSKAVEFLLSRGIIREGGASDTSTAGPGRRRTMLRFNPEAYCALGLNLEGQLAEWGLIDLSGRLLHYETCEFKDFLAPMAQRTLGRRLAQCIREAPSPVLGAGVGFPADVNPHTSELMGFHAPVSGGPVTFSGHFRAMAGEIGIPIFVENDVNLACKGELFCRGPKEKKHDLCYLTLGTGFGAGIMLGGRLWQGGGYRAGEIGNILLHPVYPDAPLSGQLAPLESGINLHGIQKRFGLQLLDEPPLTDAQRDEIIGFLLPDLAAAIYNFVFLLDIDQFILAGFIPQFLGNRLHTRLEEFVNEMLAPRGRSICLREPNSAYDSLIGAADLVFDKTLLGELQD